jgi:predicted DNA-binding protein YlxM (UPF0122 family)
VLNDLSLGEIAAEQGISRQGVYDIVKRCTMELKEYEEKLALIRKFQNIKEKVAQIKDIAAGTKETGDTERVLDIAALADDILKEL